MGICKGQNLRVLVGGVCVGYATNCTLHVAANLEDSSTKDSTGDWQEQEITGRSWDMSVDALYPTEDKVDDDSATVHDLMEYLIDGTSVELAFERTDGTKNREKVTGTVYYYGTGIVSDISIQAQNRQNSTYTAQFTGQGELAKGSLAEAAAKSTQNAKKAADKADA